MNELTFKTQKITPIIINNQPYLRVPQIAGALRYNRPDRVLDVYTRHSDEFSADMSFLTTTDTAGGKQQIRVFSLRGCHLLAMFSKTPVAKEFRKWVLDLIEARHQTTDKPITVAEHQRALPSGKREIVLSEKAKAEIGGIVKACLGTSKAGTPLGADALKQLIKEAVAEFFTPPADDGENHPSGRPFANWAVTAVHSVGAMQSEYDALRDKMKQAQNLLTAK